MRIKLFIKGMMVLALFVSDFSGQSFAATGVIPGQQPTYSNYAEAQQASKIADRQANTTNSYLNTALNRLNEAEKQMERNRISGNQQQMISAKTVVNEAKNMYMEILCDMTGVSKTDINKMHSAGSSWAEMADELGIQITEHQPMNSGLGNMANQNQGINQHQGTNNHQIYQGNQTPRSGAQVDFMMDNRATEIMSATARNTESGWAEGHGVGLQTGVHNSKDAGLMSGAAGLGNGMGGSDMDDHDVGGMSGGMGASGSGGSGGSTGMSSGSSSGGNMGEGMGGGSSSGGGHGGGGGGMH